MTNEQLKCWREAMGYGQKEAMAALGMSENAYRDMETGKSTISKRTELACAALYLGADKIAQPWLH